VRGFTWSDWIGVAVAAAILFIVIWILLARRAWRLCDAACASVRVLADHVRTQALIQGEDANPLVQELRAIRHTLFGNVVSLDGNALSCLACIAPSSRDALRELFDLAEEAARVPASIPNNLPSALDSLRRALEAQRRTLNAWAPRLPLRRPSGLPLLSSSSPPPGRGDPGASDGPSLSPEESSEEQRLTRDEAAILAGLTEKFYKSWAFRIIGLALVAAAFLAGAGTLFLGQHTLTLREDLEKTEKKGEDEINNNTKMLQESINKQMEALKVATTEIQSKKEDFERQLTVGKERIDTVIGDFNSKSEVLQKQIADTVVQRLENALKEPLSTISNEITQKGVSAKSQIDSVTSDALDPLTKRGADITEKLGQLSGTITRDDDELRGLTPALDRLKKPAAELDEIIKQLSQVKAKEDDLANSVSRAGTQADLATSHAGAAKQYADQAAEARAKAISDLHSITIEAAEQERALGGIGARIDNLNKQIEGFETKLRSGLQVALDSTALTQVMSPLTTRVKTLEDRLGSPAAAARPRVADDASQDTRGSARSPAAAARPRAADDAGQDTRGSARSPAAAA